MDENVNIPLSISEVRSRLDAVVLEAHTAVRGCVFGLRDGSPHTMDRCARLGSVLYYLIGLMKRGVDDRRLQAAWYNVQRIEKSDWREKGHRLPYE